MRFLPAFLSCMAAKVGWLPYKLEVNLFTRDLRFLFFLVERGHASSLAVSGAADLRVVRAFPSWSCQCVWCGEGSVRPSLGEGGRGVGVCIHCLTCFSVLFPSFLSLGNSAGLFEK